MTDEKKFEFNEDIENDCLMTWKNARTLGRYKASLLVMNHSQGV